MSFINKNNRIRINTFAISLFSIVVPITLFAATLDNIITSLGSVIRFLAPLIVSLALLYFFWGLAMFVLHAGDESKRAEGRQIMIWGIIALFVMVSVWGLVAVLNSTFNITPGGGAPLPQLPT